MNPKQDTATATAAAANGPFGIAIGSPLSSVGDVDKLDIPGVYVVKTPPKRHPDFETVAVIAFPGTGICEIRAVSADIENDSGGFQSRSKIDEIAEALASKYGKYKKHDFCSDGDVGCRSEFWMMKLLDNQRFYSFTFEGPEVKKAGMEEIGIALHGRTISSSYITADYVGNNKKQCASAQKAAGADAL